MAVGRAVILVYATTDRVFECSRFWSVPKDTEGPENLVFAKTLGEIVVITNQITYWSLPAAAKDERISLFRTHSRSLKIPGTCVQSPVLQGAGALGDASIPGTPAGCMAARSHRDTSSHTAVAGGARGGGRAAVAATAAAAALRRGATPTGGAVTSPRSTPARGGQGGRHGVRAGGWDRPPRDGAPLTAPVDGVSDRRRAAAIEAGAQARLPAGRRGRFEPLKSLRAVAARDSGRWGGVGGQAPSGPCDPCGRMVLLSQVTTFDFRVIATLATLTRPQIPESTTSNVDFLRIRTSFYPQRVGS